MILIKYHIQLIKLKDKQRLICSFPYGPSEWLAEGSLSKTAPRFLIWRFRRLQILEMIYGQHVMVAPKAKQILVQSWPFFDNSGFRDNPFGVWFYSWDILFLGLKEDLSFFRNLIRTASSRRNSSNSKTSFSSRVWQQLGLPTIFFFKIKGHYLDGFLISSVGSTSSWFEFRF